MSPARRPSLRCLQQRHQVPRSAGHGTRSRGRLSRDRSLRPAPRRSLRTAVAARAVDADRDQSYFLFATTRDQLAHLWFPLGGLRKPDVRALARRFALPVAEKPDSQDICFVPTGRYTDVVERLKPGATRAGGIVHIDGRELGRHEGIIHYTVGQRRGLKIAGGEPLFVLRLDADRNEVVVGPRDFLRTAGLVVRAINWLGDDNPTPGVPSGRPVFVRMRSSQPPRPANYSPTAMARLSWNSGR